MIYFNAWIARACPARRNNMQVDQLQRKLIESWLCRMDPFDKTGPSKVNVSICLINVIHSSQLDCQSFVELARRVRNGGRDEMSVR